MELDKNYKVRVTPEQSRQIQELLFALGGGWFGCPEQFMVQYTERPFFYADSNGRIHANYSEEYFNCTCYSDYTEIQADDLIALLTDLSKSAESPLQDVELTPEFEAVVPHVSEFKAGDPVYCFGEKRISKINKYVGDETYSLRDSETLYQADYLTLANQENYERLKATFPDIEFEQPPKELKGSDLAKALIEKGWVGFNCLCGHIGDENAITDTIVTGINNDGRFTTIDGRLFSNAIPMKGWRPLKAREVGL